MLLSVEPQPRVERYHLGHLDQVEAWSRRPNKRFNRGRVRRGNQATYQSILGSENIDAFYRSDLGITLNGGNVSAWADQSVNGYHATQGVAANQPPYAASGGPNNQPYVDAQTGDFLTNGALDRPPPGTTPWYWRMVISTVDFAVNARIFSLGAGTGSSCILQDASGSFAQVNVSVVNSVGLALNTFKRVECYFDNTIGSFNKSGTNNATGANPGNDDPAAGLWIHATNTAIGTASNTRFCLILIAHILPTQAQRNAMDALDANRYGAGVLS